MRLTKDSKYVLDILIANPPLGNSNTYNVIAWMGVIDEKKIHSYSDYTGILAYLAECKCIEWVNDANSDFRLTERGEIIRNFGTRNGGQPFSTRQSVFSSASVPHCL